MWQSPHGLLPDMQLLVCHKQNNQETHRKIPLIGVHSCFFICNLCNVKLVNKAGTLQSPRGLLPDVQL
jgi:hypothetical protein